MQTYYFQAYLHLLNYLNLPYGLPLLDTFCNANSIGQRMQEMRIGQRRHTGALLCGTAICHLNSCNHSNHILNNLH